MYSVDESSDDNALGRRSAVYVRRSLFVQKKIFSMSRTVWVGYGWFLAYIRCSPVTDNRSHKDVKKKFVK